MKQRKHQPKLEQTGKKAPRIGRGIIHTTSKGTGYVELPDFEEDIEIDARFLKTALNKDEVEISILPQKRAGRVQGEVIKILERGQTDFVGTLEEERGVFFLVPDNKKIHRDIMIVGEKHEKAMAGYKALVKMLPWNDPSKNPEGTIVKIIGKKGIHEVEMQSIIFEKGFDSEFPVEVESEATNVASEKSSRLAEEIKTRRDFRKTFTMTIDPADAKDFDDAISFVEISTDSYEIGIHIADVSHYVEEGGALDREARKRGFSVYLVDRTIPMLPEILSNDLCSLNPNVDRLAFSAVFKIKKDPQGTYKIEDRWFGKTVIHSAKRFSYEGAQEALNKVGLPYHKELTILNTIAKQFRAEKEKNGAIDFEKDEVKFRLDKDGVPIEVYKKARLDTHKLIEEYMLLANREVALYIDKKAPKGKSASIYRIHDVPNKEKIIALGIFLKAMGYDLKAHDGIVTAQNISAMLKKIHGSPSEDLIKTATLRSMSKAIYSTKNIGHFGLGFPHYTHFTSPIRRYADLIVHRILFRLLTSGKIPADEFTRLEGIAAETSEKEVAAAEAERASIKYKQVEYMTKHIGETFDAIISGVSEWGIFVEETNTKAEGMVRLRSLQDDFYALDEKTYSVVGEKTKNKFTLGNKVKIKLITADLDRKSLDFVFVT